MSSLQSSRLKSQQRQLQQRMPAHRIQLREAGPRSTKLRRGPNVIGVHLSDTVTPSKGLASAINVYVEKELVLREAVDMAAIAGLSIQQSMGAYDVTGVCVLLGPYLAPLVASICSQLESREQYGESTRDYGS
ncbi:hypothetical protein HPB52_003422 [Rhipicephalus sanguineus]|uniref:Uncharacterized protein n=1 Tax=Rhipicephalus sanguineus TaxID=34632 RepID=A0A9D4PV09_RHISA|nr:hypothetical protein HPB52_003422 [Rhipicephalus sanguineus]